MAGLIEHIESYLGEMEEGWTNDPDGSKMPFQMACFPQGPGPDTISFSTLGLSHHKLHTAKTGKEVRLELAMFVPESLRDGPIPSILHQVAMGALNSGRALSRGDVSGPAGPLVPGSAMEALYVGMPVYLPDEFHVFEEHGKSIVIAWLIPISVREADFIQRQGWDAFEDRLVEEDPDLTDIYRPSMAI